MTNRHVQMCINVVYGAPIQGDILALLPLIDGFSQYGSGILCYGQTKGVPP